MAGRRETDDLKPTDKGNGRVTASDLDEPEHFSQAGTSTSVISVRVYVQRRARDGARRALRIQAQEIFWKLWKKGLTRRYSGI